MTKIPNKNHIDFTVVMQHKLIAMYLFIYFYKGAKIKHFVSEIMLA